MDHVDDDVDILVGGWLLLGEPLAAVSVSVPVHRFPASRRAALVQAMRAARGAADDPRTSRSASA